MNLFADMGVQPGSLQSELTPAEASQDTTGPLARIEAPRNGALVDQVVTITGTAVDDGGVVAGVEVSVDGGATWHPVMGTDEWHYDWRVPRDITQGEIVTRAVDDSGRLGPVSSVVTVNTKRVWSGSGDSSEGESVERGNR